MHRTQQLELDRTLQTERIQGRKDWVHYVELKTAIYREHVASIEAELGPIVDDLRRHHTRRQRGGSDAALATMTADSRQPPVAERRSGSNG
jgi:hypothetical protein